MYWSMRVMAMLGVAMFLIAAAGAWLYRKRKLQTTRWFLWIAVVAMSFPYIAATAGWILTEMGRQPWIVQNLLKTSDAVSTGLSTATVAASLTVFVLLYATLGVVDFILMRRYARQDPPQVDQPGALRVRRPSRIPSEVTDMSLEEVWFVLIGVLWSGYFLLEGFDFGVGMLLPVLPRDERERGLMFESIGPVWDGNEVWLVVAAGATFAAFPAWYATLFSGFYVALLLILVLLIVRVVSFEWREKHDGARWRATWLWANTIGSFGASFLWGVALANLVAGVPLDSSHVYTGGIVDLFSVYTVAAGLAVVAMFALHGATYLSLRTAGDLRDRASRAAQRLAVPAIILGIGVAAWTVRVAHQNNDRAILPTTVPRC